MTVTRLTKWASSFSVLFFFFFHCVCDFRLECLPFVWHSFFHFDTHTHTHTHTCQRMVRLQRKKTGQESKLQTRPIHRWENGFKYDRSFCHEKNDKSRSIESVLPSTAFFFVLLMYSVVGNLRGFSLSTFEASLGLAITVYFYLKLTNLSLLTKFTRRKNTLSIRHSSKKKFFEFLFSLSFFFRSFSVSHGVIWNAIVVQTVTCASVIRFFYCKNFATLLIKDRKKANER